MYKQFYGLQDIPFSLAPDPKYLFRTESLLEVFANLQYGIENGKGLVVVTGEVGTGKTTILRSMLHSLDQSVLAAYIFNPLLSTEEFLDLLASELRLKSQPSKSTFLRMLGYVLMSRCAQGLRTVVVVDEAHLLQPHLLEEIRLLLNFETNREKLIQIVLCGQPELHDLLAQPEMRHLKQRVSLKCGIQPLTAHETGGYIRWRLRVAGARDDGIFDADAVRLVHHFSGGIPRLINNICDNALLSGFSEARPRISGSMIRNVVAELDLTATDLFSPATTGEMLTGAASTSAGDRHQRERRDPSSPDQPSNNVHYMGREKDIPERRLAASGRVKFVINPGESRNDAPGFFSRVKVNKDS